MSPKHPDFPRLQFGWTAGTSPGGEVPTSRFFELLPDPGS
jgi:hypothetical protein